MQSGGSYLQGYNC